MELKDEKYGSENKEILTEPRKYSKYELDGLPHLADFTLRTALISMGVVTEGITVDKRNRVKASIPKSVGDPLSTAQLFGRWMAWKRKETELPNWALKTWVPGDGISGTGEKKPNVAKQKKARKEAENKRNRDEGSQRTSLRKQKPSEVDSTSKARSSTPQNRQTTLNFTSNPKAAAEKILSTGKQPKRTPRTTHAKSVSNTPAPENTEEASTSKVPFVEPQLETPSRPQERYMEVITPVASSRSTRQAASLHDTSQSPPIFKVLTSAPSNTGKDKKFINIAPIDEELADGIRNKYAFSSSPKNSILGPRRTACDDCRRQKVCFRE